MFAHRTDLPVPVIRGTTDVYLIVGDPVEQVKAPEMFNRIFAVTGTDAVLVPARVEPQELGRFVRQVLRAGNIKGLWVAIPHKAPITEHLDRCNELGQLAGAVNGVRREADGSLTGGLFDGEGFMGALAFHGIASQGRRVLILGAGGGAAAIAASLAVGTQAAAEVALYDPVPGKAAAVAARIQAGSAIRVQAVDRPDATGWDLVVNASPLGLRAEDPMPCDVSRLAPHAALVDILMKNQPTPLVRAARARGLRAFAGFEMLIQQAPHYLEFFGFHDAARRVREDAGFLREQIYPPELLAEASPERSRALA